MKKPKKKILANLTNEQKAAVKHLRGPALVISPAGGGKTRIITFRVARLIQKGVDPSKILTVTFTNKAAGEMRDRVTKLVPKAAAKKVTMCTFHSFCARLLRAMPKSFRVKKKYTICDEDDAKSYIKQAMAEVLGCKIKDIGKQENLDPAYVRKVISSWKMKLLLPSEAKGFGKDERLDAFLLQCYSRYQTLLTKSNSLDFDDLMMKVVRRLRDDEQVRQKVARRFEFIQVDEYQDTNHCQFLLCKLLAETHQNLLVVGDLRQSIYFFRGADITNILEFNKTYPSAIQYNLTRNFRSVPSIVEISNQLIGHNRVQVGKPARAVKTKSSTVQHVHLVDSREEARYVIGEIKTAVKRNPKTKYGDFAILYRIKSSSRALGEECVMHSIPHKIIGAKGFYNRAIIKDLLAYLRLTVNTKDNASFVRIYNKPARGFGKVSFDQFSGVREKNDCSYMRVLLRGYYKGHLTKRAESGIGKLRGVFKTLRKMYKLDAGLNELANAIVEQTGYKLKLAHSSKEEDITKLEHINEFLEATAQFERDTGGGILEFLEWVSLMQEADEKEEDDKVLLMTCHAAKGLEFKNVFVVSLNDGRFPIIRLTDDHERLKSKEQLLKDLEEERRVFYVAITRAEEGLTLTSYARGFYGETDRLEPSRFIEECGPKVKLVDRTKGKFGGDADYNFDFLDEGDDSVIDVDYEGITYDVADEGGSSEAEANRGTVAGVCSDGSKSNKNRRADKPIVWTR